MAFKMTGPSGFPKKPKSHRLMKRADRKFDKDKRLQAKQTEALEKGKTKKAERLAKRRSKTRDKAIDLEMESHRASHNERNTNSRSRHDF